MKKIAVFIFSFVVLASYGKAKMEISNETCLKLNPQMIPCAEKLKDFILLCSNFRLSFSEKLFVCLNMAQDQNLRVHKVV